MDEDIYCKSAADVNQLQRKAHNTNIQVSDTSYLRDC